MSNRLTAHHAPLYDCQAKLRAVISGLDANSGAGFPRGFPERRPIVGREPAEFAETETQRCRPPCYGFPRTDLHVTVDGVAIKPSLALGGWVASKPAHGGAMAMDDAVKLAKGIRAALDKTASASN